MLPWVMWGAFLLGCATKVHCIVMIFRLFVMLPAHRDPILVAECPGLGSEQLDRTTGVLVSTIVLAPSALEGSVFAAVG